MQELRSAVCSVLVFFSLTACSKGSSGSSSPASGSTPATAPSSNASAAAPATTQPFNQSPTSASPPTAPASAATTAPSDFNYSKNSVAYTRGMVIDANTPTISGGLVASYSVIPALPAGLSLDPTTGTVSGIPTATTAAASYTVTATNAGGNVTTSLKITINPPIPTSLIYTASSATYTSGLAITSNLPSSAGGPVASYSVLPALPAGLSLNPTTGAISGTPTAVTAAASYTITAANAGGSTTAGVSITVNAPAPKGLTYSTNPATYISTVAITSNLPSTGGGPVASYSVLPALPTGLSLNPTTGAISGTPTAVTAAASYTVTAANASGSTTAALSITVNPPAPKGLSYSTNPATYISTVAITSNMPNSNGGAVASYSVSPPLPSGLSLNTTTGVVSGTPTAVTVEQSYTIMATNAGGSATARLDITVNLSPPSGLVYSSNPVVYNTNGLLITPNMPSSGGGAVTSYLVLPPLPAGLSLDTATGAVSGTPQHSSASTAYTITASNASGRTTASLNITISAVISTVAGTGTAGYSGDNGQATIAELNYPSGVAVDASGNLYIADIRNSRIRKVTLGGIISTVAGNGTVGYSGDNGQATSAKLNYPGRVAVDASGNLYIADSGNNRIRKVTPGGIISTVAGNGTLGYSGDNGQATSAELFNPCDVAVDASGNLYIADVGNNRIRKVTPGGIISTVAGDGTTSYSGDNGQATSAGLYNPFNVAVDASGNLYIPDELNSRIRRVTPGGIISTVAGNGIGGNSGDNGQATSAELNHPQDVAVDASGNLYIADNANSRIRKVTPDGIISTVAGNGTAGFSGDNGQATSAELFYPYSLALDASGNLYIADSYNQRIRKVNQ